MDIKCKRYLKEYPEDWEANNFREQLFPTHGEITQV